MSPLFRDRRARRGTLPLLLAVALAGCGGGEEGGGGDGAGAPAVAGGCTLGFLGDETLEPRLEIDVLSVDSQGTPLADGGDVPVIFPPQGGRVIFAGVRATNVDACAVKLSGSLRDTATGQVRVDTRIINLRPADDGWGSSVSTDPSTFANIPVCPNQWASTAINDNPFELTVTIADKKGNEASKTVQVTPRCDEPGHEVECHCICKEGYQLGEQCDP